MSLAIVYETVFIIITTRKGSVYIDNAAFLKFIVNPTTISGQNIFSGADYYGNSRYESMSRNSYRIFGHTLKRKLSILNQYYQEYQIWNIKKSEV